ncbi:hypothetical protein ACHAW5_010516 [Stephanodiscus triporus]|uniref:Uncharacterized protein n=1 Tax=Stephanodiscus triporus TaxID=2934178 RepID=A0ABD3NAU1_9STRA
MGAERMHRAFFRPPIRLAPSHPVPRRSAGLGGSSSGSSSFRGGMESDAIGRKRSQSSSSGIPPRAGDGGHRSSNLIGRHGSNRARRPTRQSRSSRSMCGVEGKSSDGGGGGGSSAPPIGSEVVEDPRRVVGGFTVLQITVTFGRWRCLIGSRISSSSSSSSSSSVGGTVSGGDDGEEGM